MTKFDTEIIIENIRLNKNNPHLSVRYFRRLMKVNIIAIICGVFHTIIQSNRSPANYLPANKVFFRFGNFFNESPIIAVFSQVNGEVRPADYHVIYQLNVMTCDCLKLS